MASDFEVATLAVATWLSCTDDAQDRIEAAYQAAGNGDESLWDQLVMDGCIGAARLVQRRLPEDPEFWRGVVPLIAGFWFAGKTGREWIQPQI